MAGWARRFGAMVAIWTVMGAGAAQAQNEKPEPPPIFVDESDDEGDAGGGGGTGTGSETEQGGGGSSGCVPACRAGFLCHQGQCVSACNPPCAPNEVCTAQRKCVPRQGTSPDDQPPPPQQPGAGPPSGGTQYGSSQPPPPGAPPSAPNDPGWGRGAAIWGLINIPILLGGATAIFFVDDDVVGPSIGGALTLYSGVTTIIVGAGAASPSGPDVRSMTGTLVPGWILYAFSMVSAIGLLASTASGLDVPSQLAYAPAGLASGANFFFAITGFVESARARAVQHPPVAPQPTAGSLHLSPMVLSTPGDGPTGTGLVVGGRL